MLQPPRRRAARRGFTLVEMIIVMAMLAILAAVGIPLYRDYVVRGRLTEAFNAMSSYALRLGQYYQDNRSYLNACTALTLPTSANFTYTCPTQTATGYVLQATGNAGSSVAGFTFTLDNAGNRATTAVPSGWTSSTSCWVNSRSGACN